MQNLKYLFTLLIGATSFCNGQNIKNHVTFKGRLQNCSNQKIIIRNSDFKDSLLTDGTGNFHYTTSKITQPIHVGLSAGKQLYFDLYLAPGFDFIINADGKNRDTFYKTVSMSGIGSKTNQYWKQDYSIYKSKVSPLSDEWYAIKPSSFVQQGLPKANLDSFVKAIDNTLFDDSKKEPFHDYFKTETSIDIQFTKLYNLFAYTAMNELSVSLTDSLIAEAINPNLFKTLSFDDHLKNYFYWATISFFYLDHMTAKKMLQNPELQTSWTKVKLDLADSLYTGKTKELVWKSLIEKGITGSFSYSELAMFDTFINRIKDKSIRDRLILQTNDRRNSIEPLSFGKEAPVFNLPDNKGRFHSLEDYRGKVVYIDLWASWCGPCREEMPYLKIINNEYANSGKVQIISIAVNDLKGKTKREDFIAKNHLTWLQLEDQNDFVSDAYKAEWIPRFILVDKKGKIVSFDAPRPSDKEKLDEILKREIEK